MRVHRRDQALGLQGSKLVLCNIDTYAFDETLVKEDVSLNNFKAICSTSPDSRILRVK